MAWIEILSLAGNGAGVILLFLFGVPFRTASDHQVFLLVGQSDAKEERKTQVYQLRSWTGLGLVLLGTIGQGVVAWMTMPH